MSKCPSASSPALSNARARILAPTNDNNDLAFVIGDTHGERRVIVDTRKQRVGIASSASATRRSELLTKHAPYIIIRIILI